MQLLLLIFDKIVNLKAEDADRAMTWSNAYNWREAGLSEGKELTRSFAIDLEPKGSYNSARSDGRPTPKLP